MYVGNLKFENAEQTVNNQPEMTFFPKTVEEIIDMYRISTPRIFQQSTLQKLMNWLTNKLAGVPIYPYGQEGLGIVLEGWRIIKPWITQLGKFNTDYLIQSYSTRTKHTL